MLSTIEIVLIVIASIVFIQVLTVLIYSVVKYYKNRHKREQERIYGGKFGNQGILKTSEIYDQMLAKYPDMKSNLEIAED